MVCRGSDAFATVPFVGAPAPLEGVYAQLTGVSASQLGNNQAFWWVNYVATHLSSMSRLMTVEPTTGIEPAPAAWEAAVLPLNYVGAMQIVHRSKA